MNFNKLSPFLFLIIIFLFSATAFAACPNKYFTESCTCSPPAGGYCITAGSKKFTYYKIATDLKDIVASNAGFALNVLEGGSVKNIQRMRWQNGVKFAIVQSDVLEFYREEEQKGNKIANELIKPLRVILPLYNEEVHIFVRKDSPMKHFRDLKNKKIALGPLGGGPAMTGKAMYRYLFGENISRENTFYSPHDEALRALAINKTVDAWIMVVGQPTSMFEKMKSNAKNLIKLVSFDETDNQEANVLKGPYFKATIWKKSYAWLEADVPTLTVKAFLITQMYTNPTSKKNIQQFTESLCKNFEVLKQKGHSKWNEVNLQKVALPGGWTYSKDVLAAFSASACTTKLNSAPSSVTPANGKTCTSDEAALGLCVPN